jgi:hypothetical protein
MPEIQLDPLDTAYDPQAQRVALARLRKLPKLRTAAVIPFPSPAVNPDNPVNPIGTLDDYLERQEQIFRTTTPARLFALRHDAHRWRALVRLTMVVYGLTMAELRSQRRDQHIVQARHDLFWTASKLTGFSLGQIGRLVGDRDHTTVMHAVRKMERRTGIGWKSPLYKRAVKVPGMLEGVE